MYPFGNAVENSIPPQKPEEFASIPVGDTVLNGTTVVDINKIRKSPIIYNPEYIIDFAKEGQYIEVSMILITGSTPNPIKKITRGKISAKGVAQGFKGPAMLSAEGDKLVLNPPETFVWGFKVPYTIAIKTSTGVDIKQGNTTIKSVAEGDINNETIPHEYMTLEEFKEWYNDAEVGNSTGVDFALSKFNDGRNLVPPDRIKTYFGDEVVKYMQNHPKQSPVMVFNSSQNTKVIGSTETVMNYYSDLDNEARASNAREFIKAWNNTIIPPHTIAYGSNKVFFVSVYDPDPQAKVKWASHGVCPPGRALRDAVLNAEFPLPSGMTMDYQDTISNYATVTSISVENTGDYPVKIIMWSDGDDGSELSIIYAEVIQLLP